MIERREKRKNNMRIPQRKEGYTVKNFLFSLMTTVFVWGVHNFLAISRKTKKEKVKTAFDG